MTATQWRESGTMLSTDHGAVFVLDVAPTSTPAPDPTGPPPLLVIHGFPSCSFDFRHVLDDLSRSRRVVLFDQLGFGWSDKPDRRYGISMHADTADAVLDALDLHTVDLLTHDMGDTVGGELLARTLEGASAVTVRRRVLTNGSIYLDLAQLTAGQMLLSDLPDEPSDLVSPEGVAAGMAATFSHEHPASDDEVAQQTVLVAHAGGQRLLPRTIRYLEDRRADEARFTGAIETHPAPLCVIWGQVDPVAVVTMTDRLLAARPDAELTVLEGVGHYPMIEVPAAFSDAVVAFLDR